MKQELYYSGINPVTAQPQFTDEAVEFDSLEKALYILDIVADLLFEDTDVNEIHIITVL
jgi:hypothetical protein